MTTTQRKAHNTKALSEFNLGTYRRSISTHNQTAADWFNRGLIWSYAFNHEAASTCFDHAIKADNECALAYWGLAYALGPNYNKPWTSFDQLEKEVVLKRTHDAISKAKKYATTKASPVEQKLIDALQYRYQSKSSSDNHNTWNQDYADQMRAVYWQHHEDLDVAALFADALMNLTPWALWDLQTGLPQNGAHTREIEQVFSRAFATTEGLAHPGLLHLHIHFWELSPRPEEALPIANKLRGLVPDAGHLNHMPSHLDLLCGNYQVAADANAAAVVVDEKYLDYAGPINFYSLYRLHDYHFLIYAAMFSAQSKLALDTVAKLEASLPEELLRVESPPMADWLEGFLSTRVHVLVRFGLWDEILGLPLPTDPELYSCTTAIYLYAKGIAHAAKGDTQKAIALRDKFRESKEMVHSTRTLFNNTFTDLLGVASAMLDGEIEYRRQNYDAAFDFLRQAIKLDDALPYDEPWGWMQPTRHAYGALLLEQNHIEQAASVYKADLGLDDSLPRAVQHRKNIWSLHGYHECLLRSGRKDEAREIAVQLAKAQENADIVVSSSCFCRLQAISKL